MAVAVACAPPPPFPLRQLILGANSLVLAALPAILAPTPGSAEAAELATFHATTLATLQVRDWMGGGRGEGGNAAVGV
jgi:hypothetical protein